MNHPNAAGREAAGLDRVSRLRAVRRFEVVGSAVREEDFDQAWSDVDLLVEPGPLPATRSAFSVCARPSGRPESRDARGGAQSLLQSHRESRLRVHGLHGALRRRRYLMSLSL